MSAFVNRVVVIICKVFLLVIKATLYILNYWSTRCRMYYLKVNLLKYRYIVFLTACSLIIGAYLYVKVSRAKEIRRILLMGEDVHYEDNFSKPIEAPLSVEQIRNYIIRYNSKQSILNKSHYGSSKKFDAIIAVEVYSNIIGLRNLIQSLEQTASIKHCLIIFSHAVYDKDINEIVQNITFTRVLQIFFPYSIQVFPDVFPGPDEHYCTEDLTCQVMAIGMRNASLSQLKHHWWWKANEIFDNIDIASKHEGPVLFLDENDYVVKDTVYLMNLLSKSASKCHSCSFLSLGFHKRVLTDYHRTHCLTKRDTFRQIRHGTGLIFNRTIWNNIKKYSYSFCYFNDYRWDRSLMNLGMQTPEKVFYVLAVLGPRVIKVLDNNIEPVRIFYEKVGANIFPSLLTIKKPPVPLVSVSEHKYWGDIRDKELCMFIAAVK